VNKLRKYEIIQANQGISVATGNLICGVVQVIYLSLCIVLLQLFINISVAMCVKSWTKRRQADHLPGSVRVYVP
jgi:hypothetical protein